MKTRFRHITLLVHERRHRVLLENLQDLGVLHLEQDEMEETGQLEDAIHVRNMYRGIIELLEKYEPVNEKIPSTADIDEAAQKLVSLEKEMEHLHQRIELHEKDLEKYLQWGGFNVKKFKPLKRLGYHIFLCSAPRRIYDNLQLAGLAHEVIRENDQDVFFVLITRDNQIDLPVEYQPLPDQSPDKLRGKIQAEQQELEQLNHEISRYRQFLPGFKTAYGKASDHLNLLQAAQSSRRLEDGRILTLSGWYPLQKEKPLTEFLDKEKIAYSVRDPEKGDQVPVMLRNSNYSRLYEPITRIFELPNYYETDLTPFIAVFYPILFAYCLGDAGYGFVLTALMVAGYFTFLKKTPRVALLGLILGVTTMVMGLVKSGSLFGITLIADHNVPWIRFLSRFVLIPDDSEFIFNAFNVALMIGVLQILTGIILSIYTRAKYEGTAYAFSPFGKLLIVVSLLWIFLADMQEMIWLTGPGIYRYGLLAAGVIIVMVTHELSMPLGRRIANAVMPLFFIFTGLLGDILSYVRLFALGLASSVLGLVVNQIGEQIMEGGIVSLILGILFLLFGHTLNFGIAALGSFVHPLRLTFVEFYGNAAFQGKGVEYKPYKKSFESIQNE